VLLRLLQEQQTFQLILQPSQRSTLLPLLPAQQQPPTQPLPPASPTPQLLQAQQPHSSLPLVQPPAPPALLLPRQTKLRPQPERQQQLLLQLPEQSQVLSKTLKRRLKTLLLKLLQPTLKLTCLPSPKWMSLSLLCLLEAALQ
jgi:hypothetical protein